MPSSPASRAPPSIPIAVTFHVGTHTLLVARVREGRWTVSVDTHLLDASYTTEATAWEAGVREAARLDLPVTT